MKKIITILTILILSNYGITSQLKQESDSIYHDTLKSFDLFMTYQNVENFKDYQEFGIRVYKKGDKYYAENIFPDFYFGKYIDTIDIWTVELDESKILICNQFLNKTKSLQRKCPQDTLYITSHIIVLANDTTIYIDGNCDWEGLDFFSLREFVFKEKIDELKIKLINDLYHKIIGKWYFNDWESGEKKHETYWLLSRKNKRKDSEIIWEFKNDFLFTLKSRQNLNNKIIRTSYLSIFEWYFDGGDIYLKIEPPKKVKRNNDYYRGEDLERMLLILKLEKITDENLKLMSNFPF